jgi:hypothetical protein
MLDDLRRVLPSSRPLFGTIIDASESGTMNPDVRDLVIHALRFMASRGMVRLAVGAPGSLVAAQFKRLGGESEIQAGLRCLDAKRDDWRTVAEHWAVSGREPPPESILV